MERQQPLVNENKPNYPARVQRLRELVASTGASAALVTNPRNVGYLTGFKGLADVDEREMDVVTTQKNTYLLLKPFYSTEAEEKTKDVKIVPTRRPFNAEKDLSEVAEIVQQEQLPPTIAVEKSHITWEEVDALESAGFQKEHIKPINIEKDLRAVKDSWEIAQLREACRIGDTGFDYILTQLKPGMTESQVKETLEQYLLSQPGVEGLSFPALVLSGAHAADPHRESAHTPIENNNFLLLDFGVVVNGYHSDMTRVVFLGTPTPEQIKMYATVLKAQQLALDYAATASPVQGAKIDAVANAYIQSQGYPEFLAYSHGIGTSDHERPNLLPTSTDIITAGMACTVEPGLYLPGIAGIRIEDEVIKTDTGIEILTKSPKDLLCLDLATGKKRIIPVEQLLFNK